MKTAKSRLLHFVTRLLFSLRVWQLFLALERRLGWRRAVICLCYHNIEQRCVASPISQMEQGTSAALFETQITCLRRWLTPIDDSAVAGWLTRQGTLDDDSLLITFDDGYRDNLTTAAPILEQLGMRGVIFIATDYIGTGKHFWWIRLSDVMRAISPDAWKRLLPRSPCDILTQIISQEDLDTWDSRVRARRLVATAMTSDSTLESFLDLLEHETPSVTIGSKPLLTWGEISTMHARGFSFGGHTHSHPRLSRLPREAIRSELTVCKEILEERLGQPICSIAYPTGDYDHRVVEEMNATTYRLAFGTSPGIITRDSCPFTLPRLYLSRDDEPGILSALVALKLAKYFPRLFTSIALRLASSV